MFTDRFETVVMALAPFVKIAIWVFFITVAAHRFGWSEGVALVLAFWLVVRSVRLSGMPVDT